jgi:hypothetical protein
MALVARLILYTKKMKKYENGENIKAIGGENNQ